MSLFSARGVRFAYAGFDPSLIGISFEIESRERVALLGANGSGKSTLLHLLNGLFFANEGSIEAFGTVLSERGLETTAFGPEFRKRVGFLFQNSDVQLFCPTVRDELAFGPLQLGLAVDQIEERIKDTLRLLGIEEFEDRSPQALSAGQKKLVALGSVLVVSPSVLLLDEPTAGLDPRSQAKLLDLLDALHAGGATLITATHDLGLVSDIADRTIVLGEDHRVVFDGSARAALGDRDLLAKTNLIFERE